MRKPTLTPSALRRSATKGWWRVHPFGGGTTTDRHLVARGGRSAISVPRGFPDDSSANNGHQPSGKQPFAE